MQTGGFGVHDRPTQFGHRCHVRHFDLDDHRPRRAQIPHAAIERGSHLVGRDFKESAARDADAQAAHALRERARVVGRRAARTLPITGIEAGDDLQHERQIGDVACHRTEHVDRRRERHAAGAWYEPESGLQTDAAVGGRRNAHRAAGVRTDARVRRAERDRDARAARRTTGDVGRIVRIATIAEGRVMPGGTESEFGHGERTEFDRTGARETLEHRGARGRGMPRTHARPVAHGPSGAREHVLVRERHTMQRTERLAACSRRIGRRRRRQSALRIDLEKTIAALLRALRALEHGARDLDAAEFARAQTRRDPGERHRKEIAQASGSAKRSSVAR